MCASAREENCVTMGLERRREGDCQRMDANKKGEIHYD